MDASQKPIALIAGATGLVGGACLRLLAIDAGVGEVRALVRRSPAVPPVPDAVIPVRECVVNYERLEDSSDCFGVDWVFCTLGTTMAQAGSRAAFRRVDFDYPLAVARLARTHGATHFLLVSAAGANARSVFFYNRVKGELEQALRALNYPALTIARPSLLLGERGERRAGEEVAKRLSWLAPSPWRPVHARQVAAALVDAAHAHRRGVRVLDNPSLRAFP